MTPFKLAAIASLLAIEPVQGQQIDCTNPQVQLELTFCAERDWQIADTDLNDAYKAAQAVMKGIDANLPKAEQGAFANLRDAQRAWVGFRDAACAAEGYIWHGGSGEPMIIYACRARLTKDRAADLWSLAEGN